MNSSEHKRFGSALGVLLGILGFLLLGFGWSFGGSFLAWALGLDPDTSVIQATIGYIVYFMPMWILAIVSGLITFKLSGTKAGVIVLTTNLSLLLAVVGFYVAVYV